MRDMKTREPITIPAGAPIYLIGNDGYAIVDGQRVRVVLDGVDSELRTCRIFNTDETVDDGAEI